MAAGTAVGGGERGRPPRLPGRRLRPYTRSAHRDSRPPFGCTPRRRCERGRDVPSEHFVSLGNTADPRRSDPILGRSWFAAPTVSEEGARLGARQPGDAPPYRRNIGYANGWTPDAPAWNGAWDGIGYEGAWAADGDAFYGTAPAYYSSYWGAYYHPPHDEGVRVKREPDELWVPPDDDDDKDDAADLVVCGPDHILQDLSRPRAPPPPPPPKGDPFDDAFGFGGPRRGAPWGEDAAAEEEEPDEEEVPRPKAPRPYGGGEAATWTPHGAFPVAVKREVPPKAPKKPAPPPACAHRKSRKVTALTVYAKVHDGLVTHVKVRRFKRRTKPTAPPPPFPRTPEAARGDAEPGTALPSSPLPEDDREPPPWNHYEVRRLLADFCRRHSVDPRGFDDVQKVLTPRLVQGRRSGGRPRRPLRTDPPPPPPPPSPPQERRVLRSLPGRPARGVPQPPAPSPDSVTEEEDDDDDDDEEFVVRPTRKRRSTTKRPRARRRPRRGRTRAGRRGTGRRAAVKQEPPSEEEEEREKTAAMQFSLANFLPTPRAEPPPPRLEESSAAPAEEAEDPILRALLSEATDDPQGVARTVRDSFGADPGEPLFLEEEQRLRFPDGTTLGMEREPDGPDPEVRDRWLRFYFERSVRRAACIAALRRLHCRSTEENAAAPPQHDPDVDALCRRLRRGTLSPGALLEPLGAALAEGRSPPPTAAPTPRKRASPHRPETDPSPCARCGLPNSKFLCSVCKTQRYCSAECQSLLWPEHAKQCVPPADPDEDCSHATAAPPS